MKFLVQNNMMQMYEKVCNTMQYHEKKIQQISKVCKIIEKYPQVFIGMAKQVQVSTTIKTRKHISAIQFSLLIKVFYLQVHKKNPAYGRQSISRPMRIVAPMP